jgi:hypothetical protein
VSENLHKTCVSYREDMGTTSEGLRKFKEQDSSNPWKDLSEESRESDHAYAAEIPRKLRMISCFPAKEDENRTPVLEFNNQELDRLTEQEHERWNAERLQKQWRLGHCDEKKRVSPFLEPWRDLHKVWQDVDRAMLESYS